MRVNSTISEELLEEVDEHLIEPGYYNSRSEVFRDGVRHLLKKYADEESEAVEVENKWGRGN